MVFPVTLAAGAAVGGAYNWASSIYTYNRDAWMTDMQLDQTRAYQLDNLRIAMKNMDREEIRDLMQSDIGRINNVIIITTLILSLAGEMLFEAQIPDDCAAFVTNVYMICLGSAILHLSLAILFGMYASNEAYATSTRMLTTDIRPLWDAHFQKMSRRQGQEFTKAFDQKTVGSIFTPPMAARLKMGFDSVRGRAPSSTQPAAAHGGNGYARGYVSSGQATSGNQVDRGQHKMDFASDDLKDEFKAELDADAELWAQEPNAGYVDIWNVLGQEQWQHFKEYSFKCAAFGTKNLLEACGYLCIARLYGHNKDAWAFWAVQAIFITLNIVMMQFLLGTGSKAKGFVVAMGPVSCAVATTTPFELVDRICVPLCYLSHVLVTAFLLHDPTGEASRQQEGLQQSPIVQETTYVFDGACDFCSCSEMELTSVPNTQQTASAIPMAPVHGDAALPSTHRAGSKSPGERRKTVRGKVIPQLMLRRGLSVVGALWTSALGWALHGSIWGSMDFKNEMAYLPDFMQGPVVADLRKVEATFPNPYFKPHALVCPRGTVFLADRYRVFRLSESKVVEPYPCDVDDMIADLAASCDEKSCWPLLLLDTSPPTVFDCSTGQRRGLLQTTNGLKRFTIATDGPQKTETLYAVQHGEVVQYRWQSHRNGWAPFWDVAKVDGELRAIDVVEDRLLLFNEAGFVEAQNLETGDRCGVWAMPPSLMGAGCGVHGSESIIVLVRNQKNDHGNVDKNAVSIMEAQLPGVSQSCSRTQTQESGGESPLDGMAQSTKGWLKKSWDDTSLWIDSQMHGTKNASRVARSLRG